MQDRFDRYARPVEKTEAEEDRVRRLLSRLDEVESVEKADEAVFGSGPIRPDLKVSFRSGFPEITQVYIKILPEGVDVDRFMIFTVSVVRQEPRLKKAREVREYWARLGLVVLAASDNRDVMAKNFRSQVDWVMSAKINSRKGTEQER